MRIMPVAICIAAMAVGAVAGGCREEKPRAGVVGWQGEFGIGSFAPDIPFTTASGKETSFHRVRQPVAILAFVAPPGETCCWLDPKLVELAERFRNDRITVAQVALPTDKCPHGAGCFEACPLEQGRLTALCDRDRIAFRTFGQPASGTALLIDFDNRILDVASVSDIEGLAKRAATTARRYEPRESRRPLDVGPED